MTEKDIFDWYVAHGLSQAGAAGMTANICIESAYNSKNLQNSYEKKLGYTDASYTAAVDSGKYKKFGTDRAGYGFCQWTSAGRKAGLLAYAKKKGVSIGDPVMQLEYSLQEMSRAIKGTLCSTNDPYEAAKLVMLKFERPANQSDANIRARGNKGKEVYTRCAKSDSGANGSVMKAIKHYLTKNRCYKSGKKMKPAGIVAHSSGCNNKSVTRYVDAPELGKVSANHWNSDSKTLSKCVHYIIGWSEKKKKVVCVQTLPDNMKCWGCGSGSKGSYNNSYIQFEICEDGLTDAKYFAEAFKVAAELCRSLMKKYGIPASKVVSHHEAHEKGYASNHGDCDHWLKKQGKNMAWFRSQLGSSSVPYKVKATASDVPVRKGPGSSYAKVQTLAPGTYTIVAEKDGWGQLKSKAGWILLDKVKRA